MKAMPVVALDGPAGAGKSTVAKKIAKLFSFTLLDTGAIYRSVALAAKKAGISFNDEPRVAALANALVAENALELRATAEGNMRVYLYHTDVSEDIRTPEISMGASTVSAFGGVRSALLDVQRNFVRSGSARGLVAEGRDIGTVVFPEAPVKIFLTASVDERARRRHQELEAKGTPSDLAQTREEVRKRDEQDENRPIAPLRRADDAEFIDCSNLSERDVVRHIAELISQKADITPVLSLESLL